MKSSVPNTVTVTALKTHDILSTTAWILGAFQMEKTLRAARDIVATIVGKNHVIWILAYNLNTSDAPIQLLRNQYQY